DRLKIDTELRITLQDDLLPLDLPQHIVFDDDDFHVHVVFDQRGDFAHQHGETAVSDDADDLPVRERSRSSDTVRQTVRHGGERTGERELHCVAHFYIARGPGCDGAAVG